MQKVKTLTIRTSIPVCNYQIKNKKKISIEATFDFYGHPEFLRSRSASNMLSEFKEEWTERITVWLEDLANHRQENLLENFSNHSKYSGRGKLRARKVGEL